MLGLEQRDDELEFESYVYLKYKIISLCCNSLLVPGVSGLSKTGLFEN